MKKITLLFIALLIGCLSSLSVANSSLLVQNPDHWNRSNAKMENVTIDVTPQGVYTQFDVYITFSSGDYLTAYSYYNRNHSDLTEIQYYFDLPKEAIVTDSWLWVENEVVIADIKDRWTANEIYEGIVNRRKDPSILYKNSDTQYELRVYPLIASETRKVMFTVLMPNQWSASKVTTSLPLDFLNVNLNADIDFIINETETWKNISFNEEFPIFQDSTKTYTETTISASNLNTTIDISYDAPYNNGVFLQKHPTSENGGYYQLAFSPSNFITVENNQNIAVVFDHDKDYTSYSKESVWNNTKEALKEALDENDNFNVFYTKFITKQASNSWIQASDKNIDSIFNILWESDPLNSHPVLPAVLGAANEFISLNGGAGTTVLISSSANYTTTSKVNQLLSDFNSLEHQHPISVANYMSTTSPYLYLSGTRYNGNSYLYQRITSLTAGNYSTISQSSSLAKTIRDAIFNTDITFDTYDFSIDIGDFGFTYSDYSVNNSVKLYLNNTYLQVGKYFQNDDFNIKLRTEYNGDILGGSTLITEFETDIDSVTLQAWTDKKISELEAKGNSNTIKGEVLDLSLAARVLSQQTAFLALDPFEFDNVTTCPECEYLVGIEDNINEIKIELNIFPNPVEDLMNVEINLPQGYADLTGTLQLLSTDGQVLLTLSIDPSSSQQTINIALEEYGLNLEAGIYVLNVQVGDFTQSIKVTKI